MKRTTGLNAGILIVILLTIITISIFNGCSSTDEIATNIGSVTGVVVDTDGTTLLTGKNVNITGINGTIGIANTTTSASGVFSYLNMCNCCQKTFQFIKNCVHLFIYWV